MPWSAPYETSKITHLAVYFTVNRSVICSTHVDIPRTTLKGTRQLRFLRRHRLTASMCVALLTAAILCSPASASTPSAQPFAAAQLRALDTAADIHTFVERHPGQFGGIYYDRKSNTVHINVALEQASSYYASSQALESLKLAPMRGTPTYDPGAPNIVTHQVRYSLRELEQIKSHIVHSEWWNTTIDDISVFVDVNEVTNRVDVGLSTITDEARQHVQQIFGDRVTLTTASTPSLMTKAVPVTDDLQVVHTTKTSTQAIQSTGGPPLIDFAPYAGGVRMWRYWDEDDDGEPDWVIFCTAGFKWHNGKDVYSLSTAGHCGPVNSSWSQGYLDKSTDTLHVTGPIGTAYASGYELWSGGLDGMLMDNLTGDPLWQSRIWENVSTDTYLTVGVTYRYNAMEGQYVCFSGSYTGTKCSAEVTRTDICIDIRALRPRNHPVRLCHVNEVRSPVRIVQHGDSGGPVFYGDPNDGIGVGAVGIIAAGYESGTIGYYTNRIGLKSYFVGDFSLAS